MIMKAWNDCNVQFLSSKLSYVTVSSYHYDKEFNVKKKLIKWINRDWFIKFWNVITNHNNNN